MLIGVSGSGKSTYAERLGKNAKLAVVSTDRIRGFLNGNEADQSNGGEVFKIAYTMINESLSRGKDVVFDATNTTNYGRNRLMRNLRYPCRKVAVLFTPPVEVALERSRMRERIVPDNVIERQYDQLLCYGNSIPDQFDDVTFVM